MKPLLRGIAALMTTAAVLFGTAAFAQDKTVLATDRDKASYMVGSDIGHSIAPVGPDLDMASFEKAIRNAFAGGKPLLTPAEAKSTGQALMARIGSRNGRPAPDGKVPEVGKDKVGLLVDYVPGIIKLISTVWQDGMRTREVTQGAVGLIGYVLTYI